MNGFMQLIGEDPHAIGAWRPIYVSEMRPGMLVLLASEYAAALSMPSEVVMLWCVVSHPVGHGPHFVLASRSDVRHPAILSDTSGLGGMHVDAIDVERLAAVAAIEECERLRARVGGER